MIIVCAADGDCHMQNQTLLTSLFLYSMRSLQIFTPRGLALAAGFGLRGDIHWQVYLYSVVTDQMTFTLGFSVLDTAEIRASGGGIEKTGYNYVLGA